MYTRDSRLSAISEKLKYVLELSSTWLLSRLRDNHPLAADVRIKMYADEQGNAKLVINDLQHEDNGLYFCVAENKAGKAKCAATLKVVGKLSSASTSPPSLCRPHCSLKTIEILNVLLFVAL